MSKHLKRFSDMGIITLTDYLLLPLYLWIIYKIAYRIRDRYYPEGHAWRPYFIRGLTVKIVGAIFVNLIYEYYFKGGDTGFYFQDAQTINSTLFDSPSTWFRMITHSAGGFQHPKDAMYISQLTWYDNITTYTTSCIGALIGLLGFTKFLLIGVLMAAISFTGNWALFRTFSMQYPTLTKPIAIATLFIPSVAIWGSALFKDTICMFAVGWITYCFYQMFEKKKIRLSLLILTAICIMLLVNIKIYILIAFLPMLCFKTIFAYRKKIANRIASFSFLAISLVVFLVMSVWGYKKVSEKSPQFAIEQVATTATITGSYLLQQSEKTDGFSYDLGELEPTLPGMLKKALPAINVTLFRPYIWESKKPVALMAALESLLFLLITLKILLTIPPRKIVKSIFQDPNIAFCLVFALFFAFFTGLSSSNFGTLSRYKIPCLPFYLLACILILSQKTPKQKTDPEPVPGP